jgi:hypothetical protein
MTSDDNFHHRGPRMVGASPLRTAVEALGRFLEAGREAARAWTELPPAETSETGHPKALPALLLRLLPELTVWHERQVGRLPPDQKPDGPVFTLIVYSTPARGPAPRPFGVRLVRKGDHWGRGGACLHTSDDPMVEVYDLEPVTARMPTQWWDAWPDVLMASSYFVSSLMGRDLEAMLSAARYGRASGLSLQDHAPEWSLDAAAMVQVIRWLEALRRAGVIELGPSEW